MPQPLAKVPLGLCWRYPSSGSTYSHVRAGAIEFVLREASGRLPATIPSIWRRHSIILTGKVRGRVWPCIC